MTAHTFDHSPTALEEKLAMYWDLVDNRDAIESRIAAAKNEKDSVNERIFRKVMADYEAALESVATRLGPLKDELDELRRGVDQDVKQLDAAIGELEDEICEAEFRYRVGEYNDDRLSKIKDQLTPKLVESTQKRERLLEQLDAMDRRRPEHTAVQPAGGDAASTTPPAGNEFTEIPTDGVQPPPAWTPSLAPDGWNAPESAMPTIDGAVASGLAPAGETRDTLVGSVPTTTDDPLAALTDPSPAFEGFAEESTGADESARTASFANVAPSTTAAAYPNLVIRTGDHAGKIVPLLPMTMSIGREHDNNIELKDPEVARYHARIVYDDGRFYVEDLESSTGTWVNGVNQNRSALGEGDVIRIGETELVIEFA